MIGNVERDECAIGGVGVGEAAGCSPHDATIGIANDRAGVNSPVTDAAIFLRPSRTYLFCNGMAPSPLNYEQGGEFG